MRSAQVARSGRLGVRLRARGDPGARGRGPDRCGRGGTPAQPARVRARDLQRGAERPQPGEARAGGGARADPVRLTPRRRCARMRDDEFERLYAAEAQGLFGFLVYRTGDRALAEDLLADTFERALRSRKRYDRRRGPAKTWLYTIALNLLRDHVRRAAAAERALERTGPAADLRRSVRRFEARRRGPARAPRPRRRGARGDRAALRRRADGAGDGRGAGGAADHRRGPRLPRAAQAAARS